MCLERLFSKEDCTTLHRMVADSDDWHLWVSILQKKHGLKRYIQSLPDPPRITFRPPYLAPNFAHDLTDWLAKEVAWVGRTPPRPSPPLPAATTDTSDKLATDSNSQPTASAPFRSRPKRKLDSPPRRMHHRTAATNGGSETMRLPPRRHPQWEP